MKAILHIGTPKTASTYLQTVLAGNRPRLRDHGIIYPHLLTHRPDHITLFCAVQPNLHVFQSEYGITTKEEIPLFRERLHQQLCTEVAAAAPDSVFVMSSENLSGNLNAMAGFQSLHAMLSDVFDNIQVVVYLRRQDTALLSMYSEFMRRGFSWRTFDEYVDHNLVEQPTVSYIDYRRLLTKWANVFGQDNVTPRIFHPERLWGGSLLSDVLSLLSDTPEKLAEKLRIAEPINVSLSAPALEFLRVVQTVVPFQRDNIPNPERARLLPRINALPSEPRPVLSRDQSARIMAYFEDGNRYVAETYFPDLDGPLFPENTDLAETSNLGALTLDQFKAYFRAVFG